MMARTFRYFKLLYIVAGILLETKEICETVDKIQITPRVEVKDLLQPRKVYRGVEKASRHWLTKIDFFGLRGLKKRLSPVLRVFNLWAIPNYILDCSSNYISKKIVISSDCDVIYNK